MVRRGAFASRPEDARDGLDVVLLRREAEPRRRHHAERRQRRILREQTRHERFVRHDLLQDPVAALERVPEEVDAHAGKAANCPRLYFKTNIGNADAGRIVMMLRGEVVPKTAENFRALCTHEKGFGFKGSSFHRLVKSIKLKGSGYVDDAL